MESAILPKHAFSPLRQKEAVFWDNSILSAPKQLSIFLSLHLVGLFTHDDSEHLSVGLALPSRLLLAVTALCHCARVF